MIAALRGFTAAGLLLAAALALFGCDSPSSCEEACLRVARCKKQAQQGEAILGEKPPPADAACMHKCSTQPDEFAKCEAIKRSCRELDDCRGSLLR